ncbi:MAG: long-chain fatty acid--CoA ligase [Acetobacteraceae bacterium]
MLHNPDDAPGITPNSVADLLGETVARFGPHPAMAFLGRGWTYDQLGVLVDRAARGLQDIGVIPGARVGLCLPNTPYYIIFYYAVLRIGGIVVNFNPLYVERELIQQIGDSGATIMVTLDLEVIYRRVANVADASGLQRIVVCPMTGILPRGKALLFRLLKRSQVARIPVDERHVAFAAITANPAPPTRVAINPADDVAVLQYTGGTTGLPKGAMLTHANLTANSRQVRRHWAGARLGEERVLAALPFFHVFAMTAVLNYSVEIGAEIIMVPRFELKQVLATIRKRRVTIFHAVPTIYTAINAASGRVDLSSLRFSVSGGAPLPGEVRTRFVELTGCKLVEGYGLTEASPVVSSNPPDGVNKGGSVGLPMLDTVIEIRDPTEPTRLLPVLERGEVCVRGPQVMAGYWNRPADTAAVFVDGALRTGDIGYLDTDGYLFLVDRIKDVILCGGYNVYPRVLEDALYQHPAVLEATVIGVPDAYRGQTPKAFVVLRPGHAATGDELRTFLTGYVSKIELPKSVEIRASLPKTLIGKLSKKELVAEEAAHAGPAASEPAG